MIPSINPNIWGDRTNKPWPQLCEGKIVDTTWVKCPVCEQPDMQQTTDENGDMLIHCTNHVCRSNGGTYDVIFTRLTRNQRST